MKRLYTSKRNLCPVCGNHHGCAIREDNLIECLRSTSKNDTPQGYRFIKPLRNGMGGLFALAEGDRPIEPRHQKRQQQAHKAAAERTKSAIPVPGIDRAIRKLHRYFGLGSKHRQELRARGLTDTLIDAVPFFSVYPNQELPPGIPANLPGVTRRGDKLYAAGSGYVCPSFDLECRINGWQIRYDNPDFVGSKYRWPTKPHLPSGELPITVCRPMGGVNRPGVRLAEGFLKPYIAAHKTGQVTIGSPNGQFAGSPKQTLAALKAYCTDNTVIVTPDKGDVRNRQVMQRWADQIEWLKTQGYTVGVEWWGQVDKSHPDIDELTGDEAIAYISPEEFLALGAQESSYTPSIQGVGTDGPISRDQWELKFGFGRRLRERVKRALSGFKGFGKAPQSKPKEAPDKSFQDANRRLQIWQDVAAKGYRYILDASAPGLGKSHAAGVALPDAFDAQKLWYLSSDHRNPTTGVIESNYVDLPVRHNGLKTDDTRHTPNGNPFLVHPKPVEEPDTRANCYRTPLFRAFAAKGYRHQESAKSSDICNNCKVAHLCKQGIGIKYGATFRGERADALSSERIRAHADSLPSLDEFDYSTSGLFWDEAGTHLKAMDEIPVSLEEFDRTWAELESKAPDLHEQFKLLRLALRPFLTGELKQPYHGWDDAAIRAMLPEKPDNLSEVIASLGALLQPDLTFLEQKAEFVTAADAKRMNMSRGMKALINEEFRRQANEELQEAFSRLPLNWLVPFLRIWNGEQGALRSEWGTLTVFVGSARHTAIAQSAKFNIFLDATISREQLAWLLGIDPDEIYVVGQETPAHGNLRIIQITGLGKLGKDRSESLQQRVAALRRALEERYPGIIFGDWKAHTQAGDGQWFVNLRGSNEFQNAPALAVFGIPYQNVGHLQALYQTLTGEFAPLDRETPHEGLQRFIEAHTEAEIEQAVGRLRSHLRPDEQLTFIFVGNYDLGFLGCEVEQIEAFQITPEAGTPAQITRWKIMEAVHQLQDQGKKVTQQALATLIGKSQELISKIAKQFGGWTRLKKLLLALLDPLYSGSNNFPGLDENEKSLIEEYLSPVVDLSVAAIETAQTPEVLEDCVEALNATILQCIGLLGFPKFLEGVRGMPAKSQSKFLSVILRGVPTALEGLYG